MKKIIVPELAESITEGTISEWLVQKGDKIEIGDPVIELETDKINIEVNSEFSGVIKEIIASEGDDATVGEAIANVEEGSGTDDSSVRAESEVEKSEGNIQIEQKKEEKLSRSEESAIDHPIASPAIRKRALELGIDLNEIKPKYPINRISIEDVEAAGRNKESSVKNVKAESESVDKIEIDKPIEYIKMSRRRQTVARNLVEAQHNAAMLTTFNEADMTNVIELRRSSQEDFEMNHDVRLGFMSFFTKAVVGALKQYPLVNAEIQGNEIALKKFYDIGIAVSTEEGLVVPVVRDADRLSFAGVEKEIADLATRARNGELGFNDLQGGSFTITNGGIFGSLMSTPIINAPQVGILGMHTIKNRPIAMSDNTIEIRPMMYLAFSYDHRIIDGLDSVQFLRSVEEMIEDPNKLLLEG